MSDQLSNDCQHNADPLRLVREGSSQDGRRLPALDPASAPLDERTPAHGMVFARGLAAYLRYFDNQDTHIDQTWQPFFAADPAVRLALAAVQDAGLYQAAVKGHLAWLDDMANEADAAGLRARLGEVFGMALTLAAQLDSLLQGLADDSGLRAELRNTIRRQLAPALKGLLLYHRDGLKGSAAPPLGPYLDDLPPPLAILGAALTVAQARAHTFAADWISADAASDWPAYLAHIDDETAYPPTGAYGTGASLFARVNHLATHNLFTSALDAFFRAYVRVVAAAKAELDASLRGQGDHEPHYALFLAFLRLLETTRAEHNTFTSRHLDFYYREVLRLQPAPPQLGEAHLLAELARLVPVHLLARGTTVKAGKDGAGREAFFALTADTVVNQGKLAALESLYRHGAEVVTSEPGANHAGRLFAAPVANSADGLGAAPDPEDPSWHPFHIKRYRDGALERIAMPPAEVGWAIASHHLLLAEGERLVEIELELAGTPPAADYSGDVRCLLTGPEGWLEATALDCRVAGGRLTVTVHVAADAAAVVPYAADVHGGAFGVRLPVVQVLLRHRPEAAFPYAAWQDLRVKEAKLAVIVSGARTLSVSNDFGAVDTSKPFQPFGPAPIAGSALVVGSREAFQKAVSLAVLTWDWQAAPAPYKSAPRIVVDYLGGGQWHTSGLPVVPVGAYGLYVAGADAQQVHDSVDLSEPALYDNSARHGYVRLRLDAGFGFAQHQADLIAFLNKTGAQPDPLAPPTGPVMANLRLSYIATQTIPLQYADAAAFAGRAARFFHVGPFGQAEPPAYPVQAAGLPLLPEFGFGLADSGSETAGALFIGIRDLAPPQNLVMLFEVAPGTADPLARKPDRHVQWSYLRHNAWQPLPVDAVVDGTAGLIRSGLVTLAIPRDANGDNTLHAPGLHWLRLSAATRVDAVCRLLLVAPQAVHARFVDRGNDPAFAAMPLAAGSIARLELPDPAVKKLSQPFPAFGGRGAETQPEFALRVSERLRHKDRAIALWDIEHLVLQAFPQIYKVKCLNHTQYEPADDGTGIYRELAPGHVTVVTIPDARFRNVRDPLKPYTSLDLLEAVTTFLRRRQSCFATLHVRNPQLEEVRVACKVKLLDGYDETYHVNLLRETVTRFLSPWAYPGGGSPSFGGRVHKSVLIDLVEEQPYVDYVTHFQLFHDIGGVRSGIDVDDVAGSLAVSILVSVPAKLHLFDVLHPAAAPGLPEQCPCEAT